MDSLDLMVLKHGWMHKRGKLILIYFLIKFIRIFLCYFTKGEHIKTWRPRYFVLKSNGYFLGYNNKPSNQTEIKNPNNMFLIKNCKIVVSDKPKANAFILKCSSNQKDSIERLFATSEPFERFVVL
jgi:hypothetical protein